MLSVSLLMKEHRLIERMIRLAAGEAKKISSRQKVDTNFIRSSVDFVRKIFLVIMALVMMGSLGYPYSGEVPYDQPKLHIDYERTPLNKLGRGSINVATCWFEVPAEVFRVSKKKDPFVGFTLGVVFGVASTLVRGATGLFEVVTFLAPPYDRPLMEPEYAIQSAGQRFDEYFETSSY